MTTPDAPAPVGLKEAAKITGLSLSTLRRRRDDLRKYGATQHEDGTWTIPIDTLVALGMLDHVKPTEPPTVEPAATPTETPTDALRAEVEKLRAELIETRHRADLAQALADERARALEDARLALRAITAAPAPPPRTAEPVQAAEAPIQSEDHRGWWSRMFGN